MNEIKCEVIRDLLPLYEDNAASQETAELVRAHLADCPACREELRKLRVPISLPPDEDEDAVKRFLEYRAEVRRKQNRKTIRAASVLAVLLVAVIAFCLWYTRPRNWAELAGIVNEPGDVSGSYVTYLFDPSDGTAGFASWRLEETDGTDPIAHLILDELNATPYRASLRNLFENVPFLSNYLGIYRTKQGIGHISLFFRTQDFQTGVSIDLFFDGELILDTLSLENTGGRTLYHVDDDLFDTLAGILMEYGTLRES